MLFRAAMGVVFLSVLSLSVAVAKSGVPDLDNSYWTHELTSPAGIIVCPAGDGNSLSQAYSQSGGMIDATITLVMLDGGNVPINLSDLILFSDHLGHQCP